LSIRALIATTAVDTDVSTATTTIFTTFWSGSTSAK